MRAALAAIESRVHLPVSTTEPRLAAILDKLTLALGDNLKRRVQFGRTATGDGSLEFAVWIPGASFTGVLVSLNATGDVATLRERAVSSPADQLLHTALGLHLSSVEGSTLVVADHGPVESGRYEVALEEPWNARWLDFVRIARGAAEDLVVVTVDGEVVLARAELAALPADDGTAFRKLYDRIDQEVRRRNG